MAKEGRRLTSASRAAPWRAAAAALLLGTGLAGGAAPLPSAAWTGGACPTSTGVTVIVDFTAFDAGVVTRCVPGSPASGLDALAEAGFAIEQVATIPGFVCRIDQRPGPAAESCATTPPVNTYWSYWSAQRGGAWAYSPGGAAGSRPAQGSVEGWSFALGGSATPPSVAPPPLAAPTPPPTAAPTPRPTAVPRMPTPGASAGRVQAPDPPSPTASATPPATARGTESPSLQPSSATPSPSANLASEGSVAAPPSSIDEGSAPMGTVVGIGLALAVGGAALVLQRRSRAVADG